MVAGIGFNPFSLSNAPGSFATQSDGYIVGIAMDDPSSRNWLAGGVLATTETLPMWGGVAVTDYIPGLAGGPVTPLGPTIARATSLTSATNPISGFSVFNQAHHMVTSVSSECPVAPQGTTVQYYRLGTRARIAVGCSASLAALRGQPTGNMVSWDFTNQVAVPAQAAYAANTVTAATWASTGGGQATYTTGTAHGLNPGQTISVQGVTPAGYNGSFTTLAGTTGSTIVVALATNPGTYASGGTVPAGGGVLPVRVLDFNVGNSIVPVYNAANGYCTWNRTGSAVLIEI